MDDLIKKQDAIDCFWDENRMMRDGLDIIKDIRSLPSAERKGEWIRNVDSLTGAIQKPYCSVCGFSAIGYHGLLDCIITKYCPNCGTKLLN